MRTAFSISVILLWAIIVTCGVWFVYTLEFFKVDSTSSTVSSCTKLTRQPCTLFPVGSRVTQGGMFFIPWEDQ